MPSAPPRLPPWRIYVYSPSGAVRDRPGFARAIRRLRALGHTVEIDPDALVRHQRFAGDDTTRLGSGRLPRHPRAAWRLTALSFTFY